MFLAQTETNLPTENISLIVRKDGFPHELYPGRHNRCLGGDKATNTRSRQQWLGAVSYTVALNGSGPLPKNSFSIFAMR